MDKTIIEEGKNIQKIVVGSIMQFPQVRLTLLVYLIITVVGLLSYGFCSIAYPLVRPRALWSATSLDVVVSLIITLTWLHPFHLLSCFFTTPAMREVKNFATHWLQMMDLCYSDIVNNWEENEESYSKISQFYNVIVKYTYQSVDLRKLAKRAEAHFHINNAIGWASILAMLAGAILLGWSWAIRDNRPISAASLTYLIEFQYSMGTIFILSWAIEFLGGIFYGYKMSLPACISVRNDDRSFDAARKHFRENEYKLIGADFNEHITKLRKYAPRP